MYWHGCVKKISQVEHVHLLLTTRIYLSTLLFFDQRFWTTDCTTLGGFAPELRPPAGRARPQDVQEIAKTMARRLLLLLLALLLILARKLWPRQNYDPPKLWSAAARFGWEFGESLSFFTNMVFFAPQVLFLPLLQRFSQCYCQNPCSTDVVLAFTAAF